MTFRRIEEKDDAAIAALIRENLEANHLDIPGTAYYDKSLDHLSTYYKGAERAYYVLTDEEGTVVGGIGLEQFEGFPECCELQKLYLADAVKGRGFGYEMIRFLVERAKEMGFCRIYLETHSNLQIAIHLYERCGFREIPRPDSVVHSTMDRFFLKDL